MNTTAGKTIEAFVDASTTAKFLSLPRRRVLELSRQGRIPAYPIGDGRRKQWRYRLSEVAEAFTAKSPIAKSATNVSSTPAVPGNRIGGNR